MTPEERFAAAEARYKEKFVTILADTPELAAEHGVRLGDSVIIRAVQEFTVRSPQDVLDDFMYETWLRCGGWRE